MVRDELFGKTLRKSYAKYEEILTIAIWIITAFLRLSPDSCVVYFDTRGAVVIL